MNRLITQNPITMSSLEIAELTNKNHADVMRDIRKIFSEVGIDHSKFADIFSDSYRRDQPCFNLPRRECDLIVAGYSAKYRLAIIDRWIELESQRQLALPDFSNPAEAARAWALQYETAQEAIRTKAEIGSRREATAMATASKAVRRLNKLERERDRERIYCTIRRATVMYPGRRFDWRVLKSASMGMEQAPIDVHDELYGTVKSYHADVWLSCYGIDVMKMGGHE